MAEREGSGDFDNLFDDPNVAQENDEFDAFEQHPTDIGQQIGSWEADARESKYAYSLNDPNDDLWDELDDNVWDVRESDAGYDDRFDGFSKAWSFKPSPTPWYRTRQAAAALMATTAAVVAIVVSGVLLVFHSPAGVDESTTEAPTPPTSAAPAPVASNSPPPPAPAPPPPAPAPPPPAPAPPPQAPAPPPPPLPAPRPAPPPPPPPPPPADDAPRVINQPTAQPPRPTKKPEIGVTRTPVTRSPMSVRPPRPVGPSG